MTTAQSDLFSAGVTMYELLGGTITDPANRGFDFDLSALNVDESVKSIVMKCTSVQPVDRYQSADELAVALGGHVHCISVCYTG